MSGDGAPTPRRQGTDDPEPLGTTSERALLATLRRELKAPVAAIGEFSAMLAEDAAGLDAALVADIGKIDAASRRLAEVVGELLDPARSQAEGAELESEVRHELRTPLNHIIGYAEMLLEDAAEAGAGRLAPDLERIVAAGRKLLDRIDVLMSLARVEAGEEGVDSLDHTAAVLIKDVLAALKPVAEAAPAASETGSILVVDDNETNRELLARRLERSGHAVALAENGRQALDALARGSFDLVLLDIVMPELNGYEVLSRMKADEALRHLPVIMITAYGEVDAVVRCLELGAEDYLTKPFNPVVLDARIGASLEKKHLRDREVLYRQRIEEEQRRSDRLLRVILPDEIVEELKATNRVAPRRHDQVAVLFTDVVGFTTYCDARAPEEVVAALQELVDAFEGIAEAHGLEKIKTIGDAFMATAGLLSPVDNPVLACVRAGLEMAAATNTAGWRVRVGVHCGEVVAGVVGRKKYLYDLWGDTVNTAARMESSSLPGAVTLSRAAWDRVAHLCRGRSRGTVAVKGKGDMEMFLVEGLLG